MSCEMNEEIRFALDAVRQACGIARKVQAEIKGEKLTKTDQSPVTVADFAVQALIGKMLLEKFPSDLLVAEENAAPLREVTGQALLAQVLDFVKDVVPDATEEKICGWIDHGNGSPPADRFWTLDPIDGTKGFIRGDQYVVAIALIEKGVVTAGVLGCPNLNEHNEQDLTGKGTMAFALRGQAAWRTDLDDVALKQVRRMTVSPCSDTSQGRVLRSVEKAHSSVSRTDLLRQKLNITQPPVCMDSQAKHVVLASGGAEMFFYLLPEDRPQIRMKIWDAAPGSILTEEAGGRVTDINGDPLQFNLAKTLVKNPGLLITNGRLHEAILEAFRQIL
ncbi:inositol monophosphatase family protein [Omnitrophica bacterium]|nr:inositol monophosphatase family protein [Candidatus Omnitrophota bacterium]